jgi:hypothetical protein
MCSRDESCVPVFANQGKANMEVKTPNRLTALLIAVNRGKTPIIELLVTKGTVPARLHD